MAKPKASPAPAPADANPIPSNLTAQFQAAGDALAALVPNADRKDVDTAALALARAAADYADARASA